jgi:hypothetical protein
VNVSLFVNIDTIGQHDGSVSQVNETEVLRVGDGRSEQKQESK